MKVPALLVYVLSLLPVWVVATGRFHPVSLAMGAVVALATAPVSWRLLAMPERIDVARVMRRLVKFLWYFAVVFVPDAVRSSIDVAWRVVNPVVPLYPGILAVPLETDSSVAVLLAADHITLTPGQLVVDIDPVRRVLYVHCIDLRDVESVRRELRSLIDSQKKVMS